MLADILIWVGYIALFIWLSRKGSGHDVMASGRVGFAIQAFAYVATYISAVALVGFGGLAYTYGMQMLLVAAGNVWLGTWIVYRYLAWPTRVCQRNLQARTPVQLLANGHRSPLLGRCLALIFAVFLGVYASAVIKGAALLLAQIMPVPVWLLIWAVALLVAAAVYMGGLRGVLYTEAMQGFVMLAGICMLVVAVFNKVGGPLEGMAQLAGLAPTAAANAGFVSLADGGQGWFIISLVIVTSVAVWAQPQMIQRHFALTSARQVSRITPLAMLVLTVLVGGAYYAACLARLFMPDVSSPDEVMPALVKMLLPETGQTRTESVCACSGRSETDADASCAELSGKDAGAFAGVFVPEDGLPDEADVSSCSGTCALVAMERVGSFRDFFSETAPDTNR